MAEMTKRENLVAMMDRLNEIGADVKKINDRLDRMDRRLEKMEDSWKEKEQD